MTGINIQQHRPTTKTLQNILLRTWLLCANLPEFYVVRWPPTW